MLRKAFPTPSRRNRADALKTQSRDRLSRVHGGSEAVARRHGPLGPSPPVATERFLFAAEMNLTDLATGAADANRITKAARGRGAGLVVANGSI